MTMKTRVTQSQDTGCFNGWVDGLLVAQAPTKDACKTYLAAIVIGSMGFVVETVKSGSVLVDLKGSDKDLTAVEKTGHRFGLWGRSLIGGKVLLHN